MGAPEVRYETGTGKVKAAVTPTALNREGGAGWPDGRRGEQA